MLVQSPKIPQSIEPKESALLVHQKISLTFWSLLCCCYIGFRVLSKQNRHLNRVMIFNNSSFINSALTNKSELKTFSNYIKLRVFMSLMKADGEFF